MTSASMALSITTSATYVASLNYQAARLSCGVVLTIMAATASFNSIQNEVRDESYLSFDWSTFKATILLAACYTALILFPSDRIPNPVARKVVVWSLALMAMALSFLVFWGGYLSKVVFPESYTNNRDLLMQVAGSVGLLNGWLTIPVTTH